MVGIVVAAAAAAVAVVVMVVVVVCVDGGFWFKPLVCGGAAEARAGRGWQAGPRAAATSHSKQSSSSSGIGGSTACIAPRHHASINRSRRHAAAPSFKCRTLHVTRQTTHVTRHTSDSLEFAQPHALAHFMQGRRGERGVADDESRAALCSGGGIADWEEAQEKQRCLMGQGRKRSSGGQWGRGAREAAVADEGRGLGVQQFSCGARRRLNEGRSHGTVHAIAQ